MSKFIRKQKPNLKKNTNKTPVIKNNNHYRLTEKRSRFLDEYFVDYNATQAAIRAGYSPKSAYIIGYEILNIPYVKEIVQIRKDEIKAKLEIDQEWVLKRYKMLVDYSIHDFFDSEGNMRPLNEIPRDKLYAVCGFKASKKITDNDVSRIETIIKEFKLPDKRATLDSLAKYLGMFEKDNNQKRSEIPDRIEVRIVD